MLASGINTGVASHEAGCHVACDAERKWALVAGSYGLAAFDIRDVKAPSKMAFVKTGVASFKGGCYVLIDGEIAYAVGGYGLAVIDLGGLRAQPAHMEKISGCNTGVCTVHGDEACQLKDGLLFVAGGDGFIFDTNTIHRGQPGVHLEKRDVLLFEFNLRSDLRTFREKASGGEKARSCGPTAMQVNSSFSLDRIRRRHAHGQHLRKSRAAGAVGGADGIEAWTSRLRETSKTLWP